MTTEEAIEFFKTQVALAAALQMNQSSISTWGARPPTLRQLQIEAVTGGKLRADQDCDRFRVPAQKKRQVS